MLYSFIYSPRVLCALYSGPGLNKILLHKMRLETVAENVDFPSPNSVAVDPLSQFAVLSCGGEASSVRVLSLTKQKFNYVLNGALSL